MYTFKAPSCTKLRNFLSRKSQKILRKRLTKKTRCLRFEYTDEAAMQWDHDVMNACSKGGFSLSKIVSNKRTVHVLETISTERRSKSLKNVELCRDLPMESALGINWCVVPDELGFRITLKDMPLTRRGILPTISSMYDPLGIAAPVILQGKKILQELCVNSTDWDAAMMSTSHDGKSGYLS